MVFRGRVGNDELVGHGASIQAVEREPEHLGLSAGELAGAGEQVDSLGGCRRADVHGDPVCARIRPPDIVWTLR